MKVNDEITAVWFKVNDIEDATKIPVLKSKFKVVAVARDSFVIESTDEKKTQFGCFESELNVFRPIEKSKMEGEEAYIGLFDKDENVAVGLKKMYEDKISLKLNELFDKELQKHETEK